MIRPHTLWFHVHDVPEGGKTTELHKIFLQYLHFSLVLVKSREELKAPDNSRAENVVLTKVWLQPEPQELLSIKSTKELAPTYEKNTRSFCSIKVSHCSLVGPRMVSIMTQIRQLSFSQVCLSGGGWGCELFEAQATVTGAWGHWPSEGALMDPALCTTFCTLHEETWVQSSSWWVQLRALHPACSMAPQVFSLHPDDRFVHCVMHATWHHKRAQSSSFHTQQSHSPPIQW